MELTLPSTSATHYRVYQEWCVRTGAVEYRPSGFRDVMIEKGARPKKTGGGRIFYTGVVWSERANIDSLLAASGYGGAPL